MKNLTVLFFLFCCFLSKAQPYPGTVFPVPPPNPNQLFYIQRTHNINTIVYELNVKNNLLDKDNPVHPYWIRYTEKGQRQELSFIQRKFAYGVNCREIAADKYEIHLVAYKKYLMHLEKAVNWYHVYGLINKKQAIITRVFIRVKPGGSFWSPNIESVEVKGTDPASGAEVVEIIKIS